MNLNDLSVTPETRKIFLFMVISLWLHGLLILAIYLTPAELWNPQREKSEAKQKIASSQGKVKVAHREISQNSIPLPKAEKVKSKPVVPLKNDSASRQVLDSPDSAIPLDLSHLTKKQAVRFGVFIQMVEIILPKSYDLEKSKKLYEFYLFVESLLEKISTFFDIFLIS